MPVPDDHEVTQREAIYDRDISPLMTRIIALCKEHDIPMLASFDLDDDRDGEERKGLKCSTAILPRSASKCLHEAFDAINARPMFAAFTIVTEREP